LNVQLSLEPNANPAGKAFQQAMFAQSIPPMSAVDMPALPLNVRYRG
jgi:hypothetical protein